MANRTVSVGLSLDVSRYVSGGKQAIKVTQDFRSELSKAASKGDLDAVASQATAAGLALTGAFAGISAVAARFESAMSSVSAATMASAGDMGRLREAALEAGAATSFSATDAAQGIEELAKAGVSTSDILGGGLAGALDLAAAGGLEVGAAAESAASAMTQFGLAGSDVTHIADLLAAGAGKAQGSVHDMSMALNQGGLVAAQTGLTIEETAGTLAAFASAGLLGSDAGTSFKTMLLRLSAPAGEAAELMAELGINAFDASGEFIGMAALAGNLQAALGDMSAQQRQAALATIFGTDAIRSASIVYEQGADGIQDWINKTDDQGFAAETAARKLDNLMGDVEALTGSLETLAIQSGSGANSGLRVLTQTATALVNQFGELPPAISGTAVVLGGLSGAGLLAFSAFIKIKGSAADALEQLRDMGPAGTRAAAGLSRAAVVAARVAGVLAGLQIAAMAVDAVTDDLNPRIDALTEGLTRFSRSGQVGGEAARVLGENMRGLEQSLRLVSPEGIGPDVGNAIKSLLSPAEWGAAEGSVKRAKQEIAALDEALASMVTSGHTEEAANAFQRITDIAEQQGVSVARLKELLPSYAGALEVAGTTSSEAIPGMEELSSTVEMVAEDVAALNEEFERLFGIQMNLDTARIALQEGFAALAEELDEGATSLSLNTQAGRDNRTAVLDQITAIADLRQANIDNGMSMEEANGKYDTQLDKVQQMLVDRGFEEGAVRDLIGAYRDIPGEVSTSVQTPGLDRAKTMAEAYRVQLGYIPSLVTTQINTHMTRTYGPGANTIERWGGIVAAQRGMVVPAHTVSSPTVMYGERETGGEAYIPRFGDPARSMQILAQAASWYGMRLAGGGASGGSSVPSGGAVDERGMARAVAAAVGRAIDGARIVIDDRGQGRLVARQADLLVRGG